MEVMSQWELPVQQYCQWGTACTTVLPIKAHVRLALAPPCQEHEHPAARHLGPAAAGGHRVSEDRAEHGGKAEGREDTAQVHTYGARYQSLLSEGGIVSARTELNMNGGKESASIPVGQTLMIQD